MKPTLSYIPPSGKAKIAFVGGSPTLEETIKGQPMSGPSGRVFNGILRSAGIDRDECYIGHVFDRPLDEGLLQSENYIAEQTARLNNELTAVAPNVIVPLGGEALYAFTGSKNIKNFRGAVTAATYIMPGAKLVPSFDPDNVRKAWHLLSISQGDYVKAADEADRGSGITYPKVNLLIEPTIEDIRKFVPLCLASPKLSVDIETGWGQITAIAFAPDETVAMSMPFVDLRKANKSYWMNATSEFEAWRLVGEIGKSDVPKLGQNFMYDIMWLYHKHGVPMRNYRFDTRIRHKTMYPELPADLATMSASYTRIGSYKGWGGRYQSATDTSKKDA